MKQSEMIDQQFDKIYWIYKHAQPTVFQDLFQIFLKIFLVTFQEEEEEVEKIQTSEVLI